MKYIIHKISLEIKIALSHPVVQVVQKIERKKDTEKIHQQLKCPMVVKEKQANNLDIHW